MNLLPSASSPSSGSAGWRSPAGNALAGLVRRTRSWWEANIVLGTCLAACLILGGLLVWGAGELYESVVEANGLSQVDRPVLDWVLTIRNPGLTAVVNVFSISGGPIVQPVLVGLVTIFICWWWRSRTPLVLVVVSVGASLLATVVGKRLVGRTRPPLIDAIPPFEVSPSFPSGHTLNATVIAGILCYLMLHSFRGRGARAAWIAGFSLYAVAMGLSRVYLGHHWLTDVLCGWILGLAWLLVVVTLHRLWLTAQLKHGVPRWVGMLTPAPGSPAQSSSS